MGLNLFMIFFFLFASLIVALFKEVVSWTILVAIILFIFFVLACILLMYSQNNKEKIEERTKKVNAIWGTFFSLAICIPLIIGFIHLCTIPEKIKKDYENLNHEKYISYIHADTEIKQLVLDVTNQNEFECKLYDAAAYGYNVGIKYNIKNEINYDLMKEEVQKVYDKIKNKDVFMDAINKKNEDVDNFDIGLLFYKDNECIYSCVLRYNRKSKWEDGYKELKEKGKL